MYKQNSEYKSIQKKLVAAVAMVLVACIMVVSSSYAWFTLSTAPEVKGITTSVGSNGNLEMALREVLNVADIDSLTSNTLGFPNANKYWGNLVDLSDTSYGLSNISLAPARLHVSSSEVKTEDTVTVESITAYGTDIDGNIKVNTDAKYNGNLIKTIVMNQYGTYDITYEVVSTQYKIANREGLLLTATYGPDGRISAIDTQTSNGWYNGKSFTAEENKYGVLGIGTVSGMSDAQIALRNAKTAVKAAIEQVRADAISSMNIDGAKLANLIMEYAMASNKDSVTYDANDVAIVATAIGNLQTIADTLKATLDEAIVAVGMAQGVTVTKVDFDSTNGFVVTDSTTDKDLIWDGMTDIQTSLKSAYTELATMNANLKSARDQLPTLEGTATTNYTTLVKSLGYLIDSNSMTFTVGQSQHYTVTDLRKNLNSLIGDLITNDIVAHITKGIYAEIARFVDNYEGETKLTVTPKDFGYGTSDEQITKAVILQTEATEPTNGFYLPYAQVWLNRIQITGEQTGSNISDLYGYLIDMAFRTNAVDSSLMLQTSAVSRVGDDKTPSVQGGGSYMQFTIGQNDYTKEQMIELMKAIRVVFFDNNGNILEVAALDLETGYKLSADERTVKADLRLFEYSVVQGALTLGDAKEYEETDDEEKKSTKLLDLVQNQATAVSMVVYLDGDLVENGDVAISGKSMTGTMNLQFSSSAALDPMDYAFPDGSTETTAPTPTLTTPNATLQGKALTLNGVENATTYTIAVDGEIKETVQAADIATPVDLTAYLTGESHTILVVALGENDTFSAPQTITYTATP